MPRKIPATTIISYTLGDKLRLEQGHPDSPNHLVANVRFLRKIGSRILVRIVRILEEGRLSKVHVGSTLEAKPTELIVEIDGTSSANP